MDDQPAPAAGRLGQPDALAAAAELASLPEVRVLRNATAFGIYEANCVMVAQAARLWQVRARQVVVATGAHERPLVFADNDRPGVMLAGAARTYAHGTAWRSGTRCVVFTNNDSAYDSAVDLAAAGIDIAAIVDIRPDATAAAAGIDILRGQAVVGTDGDPSLQSILLSDGRRIECDVLAVSGGFNPVVHLASQAQARLRFDDNYRASSRSRPVSTCASSAPPAAISTFAGTVAHRWLIEAPDGDLGSPLRGPASRHNRG